MQLIARDTPEPSPLAHEILNARPYAFLDDAPLEERRTQAVYARRATEPSSASELGALSIDAIERVRDEVRPDPRDADELHDALLTAGFLTRSEGDELPAGLFDRLRETGRAAMVACRRRASGSLPSACPRSWPCTRTRRSTVMPFPLPPAHRARGRASRRIFELLRDRLTIAGPTTAAALARSCAIDEADANAALLALESDGAVLRGSFTPGASELEWCDRSLLARIHRYTLNALRAEIAPVSPAEFMRFLFAWQHVEPSSRLTGLDGLRAIVATLDGYELAASSWERTVLPARMDHYERSMLDMLCLTGEVGWARLSKPTAAGAVSAARLVGTTPVALFLREHADLWLALSTTRDGDATPAGAAPALSNEAQRLLKTLQTRGASFLRELKERGESDAELAVAIGELVAAGLVASDGFAGLRAIVRAASRAIADSGWWHVGGGPMVAPSCRRESPPRRAMPRSKRRRGRCCAGTAWCFAVCCRARRTRAHGAS